MKCPQCRHENPEDTIYCGKCGTRITFQEEIPPAPGPPTRTIQAPSQELETGTTFAGRYQVIEEIGRGGMGRVYKVLDREINEKVALKLIKGDVAADKDTINRFRNELKNARKISHKNVCRMYHLGMEKGTPYITMEYVPGEDLKSLISRIGQFTVRKAVLIARQVCEGLAEAHRLGVVHRDLKPQNIMIDKVGNARIMDFGIARSLKAEGITRAGILIGTPEYMSPEQAEGLEVDARSDIYSLGLILYEMLTGTLPFKGEIPLSLAMKHMGEGLTEPRALNPQIPEELNRLILKCLEEDREKRYQSAEEVLRDLERLELDSTTTEAVAPAGKPVSGEATALKFVRKKWVIPALGVAASVVAAVLVWAVFFSPSPVRIPGGSPSLAVLYFKNNTGDPGLDHWREMVADSLIADLSQSRYIDVLSSERLYQILKDLDQVEVGTYPSEILAKVAARSGANVILLGNYAKAGDTIRIHATLLEAGTEKRIASFTEEGTGEASLFSMVDSLTRKIKEHLPLDGQELSDDLDEEVGVITTRSPEAYRYYVEGRREHLRGEYRKSIALMEKAVALDPEFAMAYRSMGVSYNNLGLMAQSGDALRKALEFSGRLSRKEQYLIQGDMYRRSEETYAQAIEAYTRLLELYPRDTTGSQNLGTIYFDIEEWDKAAECFERAIAARTSFVGTYDALADIFKVKGLYLEAEHTLRDYLRNFPDLSIVHISLAHNHLLQKQSHFARIEIEKASTLAPDDWRTGIAKGNYALMTGNFGEAEREYSRFLEYPEPASQYFGRHGLANVALTQGKFREAGRQLEQLAAYSRELGVHWSESQARAALALILLRTGRFSDALKACDAARDTAAEASRMDLQRLALHYKGLVYASMGSRTRAQQTAEKLRRLVDQSLNRKEMRRYQQLSGTIELKKKRYPEAIARFEEALSLVPHEGFLLAEGHLMDCQALYLESLARAHYRAGDLQKALEHYEKITSLTAGRLFFGDVYARSFYMLGRIYQRMGERAKAEENFNRFIALWLNADPGIGEVAEAKRRLSELSR